MESRNNYLILTPDGVGSTYLQRALTVYLQFAGLDYWNTHELLNGLGNNNGSLYKDFSIGHSQPLEEICNLLLVTGNLLVSRVANYYVDYRRNELGNNEDYDIFYKECKRKFNTVLFCERDPFEYALSWSIRDKSKKLNVYSVNERITAHGINVAQEIDLDYFQKKLAQYIRYEYWASENFNVTKKVNYNDLHNNVDLTMQNITGLTHSIEEKIGISLQDYSRYMYLSSLYLQTNDPKYVNGNCIKQLESMCALYSKIDNLHSTQRLPTTMPLKMNTLVDKRSRVTNFNQAVDTYNAWASKSNRYKEVTDESINKKIKQEQQIYNVNR